MNHSACYKDFMMKVTPIVGTVLLVASTACHTPPARAQMTDRVAPDLSIGAAQYPDDDAIILRWEQHWMLGLRPILGIRCKEILALEIFKVI